MAEAKDAKIKNIHQRIAAITAAVGAVKKTGKNDEQHYEYMEYDAVTAALRGLMYEHGITVLQNTKADGRHPSEVVSKYGAKGVHLIVDYIFTVSNVDDPADKLEFNWNGESIDFGDKATSKASTSAEKYFLMKLFKIGSKDDPDKDSPDLGTASAQPTPQARSRSTAPKQPTSSEDDAPATKVQRANIKAILSRLGYDEDYHNETLTVVYDIMYPDKMTVGQAKKAIAKMYTELKEKAAEQQPTTEEAA